MNVNGGEGLWHGGRMPQRGIGLQPNIAATPLRWVTPIKRIEQPQRGCGRLCASGNRRNRVAVEIFIGW
jgi:hypothetical protein